MKKLLFFFFITLIFSGCTSSIQLEVLKPADIMLPPDIQKFTLVNRSRPDKQHMLWSVVEGVLNGQGLFEDREAAEQCMGGLMQTMMRTPRYTITQASIEYKGTGTEIFAPPLEWSEVENLCAQYNSEALIVLEAFESISHMTYDSKPVQVNFPCWDLNRNGVKDKSEDVNKDGTVDSRDCGTNTAEQTVTTTEFYTHAKMEVRTGWRIYFPKEKRIVDEFRFSDFMNFEGKGPTSEAATAALPNKRECTKQAGAQAGGVYGYRIAPQWITVTRQFFTSGNDFMKEAGRKARRVNDWKGAMEIWKKEALNQKRKIAWHANYNMAVACEREGNLDIALEWAKKAYEISGRGVAAQYINDINLRIAEKKRADEQMGGKQ